MARINKQVALLLSVSHGQLDLRWLTPTSDDQSRVTGEKIDQLLLPAIDQMISAKKGQNLILIGLSNSVGSFASSRIILSLLNSWSWLRQTSLVSLTNEQFQSLNWSDLKKFDLKPGRSLKPHYRRQPEIGRSRKEPGFTWRS